jgi:hypothetical protein
MNATAPNRVRRALSAWPEPHLLFAVIASSPLVIGAWVGAKIAPREAATGRWPSPPAGSPLRTLPSCRGVLRQSAVPSGRRWLSPSGSLKRHLSDQVYRRMVDDKYLRA